MDRRLEQTLGLYHPAPGPALWHGGATVLGSLRGVRPEVAAWRPDPSRHSIWELVLHVAYWKYAVLRRVTGAERGTFPRAPSDWPDQPERITEKAWKADRHLLKKYHTDLLDLMAGFDPLNLDDSPTDSTYSCLDLFMGIVMHDTYHTGQIQLTKRLFTGP